MPSKDFSALCRQAAAQRSKSDFPLGQKTYARALRLASSAPEKILALQGLADCARLSGNFKVSASAYTHALKLVPRQELALGADLRCGLALAWRASGRAKEAVPPLKQALALYTQLKDPEGRAFVLWALGGTLRIVGDQAAALKPLKQAEAAYRKLADLEGASYVQCALGGVNRMLGRWPQSRHHYSIANQAMRARGDRFGIAYSYCGLGNCARMVGDLKTALVFFKKAEKDYAKIGDRVSYAYTLWSLATAYKLDWNVKPALAALTQAQRLFQATGDQRGEAYVALTLAELAVIQGKLKLADKLQKRALKLTQGFAWEQRHVKALGCLMKGDALGAKKAYAGSGSKFFPTAIPANWP